MKSIMFLSFILLLASFGLTWIIKKISHEISIFDIPNKRSSHSDPTPTGGGMAIVITWYIGITFLGLLNKLEPRLYFALLSGIILAIISLVDDFVNLKPWVRLITQLLTSIIAFIILGDIKSINAGGLNINIHVITYPLVIMGMIWFINLFNFLDGIDGYASTEAISIAFILLLFTGDPVLAVLIACTLGFLIWNWPKAKIFMGDVGSTQLGFIIVVLGIYFHNKGDFSIINWIIITSPFWFDATLTLFRRLKNKEKLSQAHRKHVYQRLVISGFSHLRVDIFLILINIILIFMVLICIKYKMMQLPIFILTVASLYLVCRYADKRKPF